MKNPYHIAKNNFIIKYGVDQWWRVRDQIRDLLPVWEHELDLEQTLAMPPSKLKGEMLGAELHSIKKLTNTDYLRKTMTRYGITKTMLKKS